MDPPPPPAQTPPPPPLPMFEADSQNLLLKLFGPPLAGTIRAPWEEGGPRQAPLQTF